MDCVNTRKHTYAHTLVKQEYEQHLKLLVGYQKRDSNINYSPDYDLTLVKFH